MPPTTSRLPLGRGARDRLRGIARARQPMAGSRAFPITLTITNTPDPGAPTVQRAIFEAFDEQRALLLDTARRVSSRTVDTGLFLSDWTSETRQAGDRTTLRLSNGAPYALFVHRAGQKGQTVVNRYLMPFVHKTARRIAATIEGDERLRRAIVAEVLDG